MSKNTQREIINISLLPKNKSLEEKTKQSDNNKNKHNNLSNIPKNEKKDNLPKIIPKKEQNNNDTSNSMLNKKRERTQTNNKEPEGEINNNTVSKKKMSLTDAKKEMKEFELLIMNTEKELQKKYGFIFPDLSYEDKLPDEIKNKLIDNFLEKPDIKKILNEVDAQK